MGKFDLRDILKGDSADQQADDTSQPSAEDAPTGSSSDGSGGMFVRNNPEETPRPPDLTGSGLGGDVPGNSAIASADPTRLKPQDALARRPRQTDP